MLEAVFEHPVHGQVQVYTRRNASHLTARWKNGRLTMSVPYGTPERAIRDFADNLPEVFASRRPSLCYRPGQTLRFAGLSVEISTQTLRPDQVVLGRADAPLCSVQIGSRLDPQAPATVQAVSNALLAIARRNAHDLLLPRARWWAITLGRRPAYFTISKGHRVLGRCSSSGAISLSYMLVFLPQELRDYVICHEIGHLSEMNHSPEFHRIVNDYLQGREAELARNLHNFKWPIWRR